LSKESADLRPQIMNGNGKGMLQLLDSKSSALVIEGSAASINRS
jgi:hypothetical protein